MVAGLVGGPCRKDSMRAGGRRCFVLAAILLLVAPSLVAAQTYDLSWYTVDGGGGTFSTGGPYSLGGTIAQPDASGALTGGIYTVSGGFWNDFSVLPPTADLEVTQSDSADPVVGLQDVTYSVTVTNIGPHSANSVSLANTLDPDVSLVSFGGTGWACGESGGIVSCTRANLPPGAALDIDVVVTAPPLAGSVTNEATATANEGDPASGNDTSAETTAVTDAPAADLDIIKDDGGVTGRGLDPLTYTITVTNLGPDPVTAAVVGDVFPIELSGVGWTCAASAGSSCAASGSGGIADTPNLLASGTATYTATGTVALGVTSVTNNATVAVPAGTYDAVSANDLDAVVTPIVDPLIFLDGFESGDTSQWSNTVTSVLIQPEGLVPLDEGAEEAPVYRGSVRLDPLTLPLENERYEIRLGSEEPGDRFGLLVERDGTGRFSIRGWVEREGRERSLTPAYRLSLRAHEIQFEWQRGADASELHILIDGEAPEPR